MSTVSPPDYPQIGGSKKARHSIPETGPPHKKRKQLLELGESSDEEDAGEVHGEFDNVEFQVNEEFARRFEHNKKREELTRCKVFGPFIGSYRNSFKQCRRNMEAQQRRHQ